MFGFFWLDENMFLGEFIGKKMGVFCLLGVFYIDVDISGVKEVVEGKKEMEVFIVYL